MSTSTRQARTVGSTTTCQPPTFAPCSGVHWISSERGGWCSEPTHLSFRGVGFRTCTTIRPRLFTSWDAAKRKLDSFSAETSSICWDETVRNGRVHMRSRGLLESASPRGKVRTTGPAHCANHAVLSGAAENRRRRARGALLQCRGRVHSEAV